MSKQDKMSRVEAVMLLLDINELEAHRQLNESVDSVITKLIETVDISKTMWSQHAKKTLSPIMKLKVELAKANMVIKKRDEEIKELRKSLTIQI